MATSKRSAAGTKTVRKKAPSASRKKKVSATKKAPARAQTAAARRKDAGAKMHALTAKLTQDLESTSAALRAARAAAREEIELARAAGQAEATVLKDQLKEALKREQALIKLGQNKAKIMLAAGEQWEKKQLARIRKIANM